MRQKGLVNYVIRVRLVNISLFPIGQAPRAPFLTVESEGRQMKQCWIKYFLKIPKNPSFTL